MVESERLKPMRQEERRLQRPRARPKRRQPAGRSITAASANASAQVFRGAALVFVVALVLRLLYVLSIHNAYFFHQLQTEPLHYHEWASRIVDGPAAPLPPFEQSPGYPYFLAAVYALFGRSATAVACVQAILDAATCALLTVIGQRWFGARAGLIAGAFAAVYGPFIYFSAQLLPSTLFVFLSVAALAAGTFSASTLAGGLWSAALLVRSEIVLAMPFVLAEAWTRGGRGAIWKTATPVAVCIAIMLAFNAAGSGTFVLFTTSDGVNLWLGNNPHADGVNPFIYGPLDPVADEVRAHAATGVEADRIFRRHALAFVHDEPGHALQLLWKKLLWTVSDRELPNTDDIEWVTAHSWLFWRPLFPLSFGMVLPLAGMVLMGRQWRMHPSLAGLIVAGLMTGVVFFTNARFRLIVVPPVLLLAALAIDRLPAMLTTWKQTLRALLGAATAFVAGLVLAWGNFYGVRTYRIPQISVNTGAMEREAGHFDAAVHHLRDGLAADPHDVIGWIHLALALEQQGHFDAAGQAYRDALAQLPGDPEVTRMAERFFQRYPGKP